MFCRRCSSAALIALEVFDPQDYPVYRCRPCGFLFSPGPAAAAAKPAAPRPASPGQPSPGRPIPSRRPRR